MTDRTRRAITPLGHGLRLGRYAGVEIFAHWSLLIIFGLIMVSLGAGVFAVWHPEWSTGLRWAVAFFASALFFVSIAVHELSHALVGRSQGIAVPRITLFVFGGMAHAEGEPRSARAEFLMAAVGPLVSLAIGVGATLLGSWMAFQAVPGVEDDPVQLMAQAGPWATLFLWLGPVNILLAIFNMVPGFPLDGGRVLRAILWWATGDLKRATQYAVAVGQIFAWLLIACGILMILGIPVPVFGVGLVPGLWIVLIGWFLHNAAQLSYQQVLVSEALDEVSVRDIMRSRMQTVQPSTPIAALVNDYFMNFEQRAFPVVREDGTLLGLVCLEDVRSIPRDRWALASAADAMTPLDELETMRPEEPAMDAFRRLNTRDVDQIPVLDEGHLLGMVHRRDIMKWLSLHTPS